jgi:hypothetical protein
MISPLFEVVIVLDYLRDKLILTGLQVAGGAGPSPSDRICVLLPRGGFCGSVVNG